MPRVTVDVWQCLGDNEGIVTYKMAGLCDEQPWCATVDIETDGREMEYTHHWGVALEYDPELWDSFLVAMSENESLLADMNCRSE